MLRPQARRSASARCPSRTKKARRESRTVQFDKHWSFSMLTIATTTLKNIYWDNPPTSGTMCESEFARAFPACPGFKTVFLFPCRVGVRSSRLNLAGGGKPPRLCRPPPNLSRGTKFHVFVFCSSGQKFGPPNLRVEEASERLSSSPRAVLGTREPLGSSHSRKNSGLEVQTRPQVIKS